MAHRRKVGLRMCPDRFTEVRCFMLQKHLKGTVDPELSFVSHIVCFGFFVFGSVIGTICAASSIGSTSVVVNSSLERFYGYISVNDISLSFLLCGISIVFILLIFISSFFLFGSVSVSVILFIKAFSFSFCFSSIILACGKDVLFLFLVYSLCDLFVFIPVCICMSVRSFQTSCRLFGKVFQGRLYKPYDRSFLMKNSILFVFAGAAIIAQIYLLPLLAERYSPVLMRKFF